MHESDWFREFRMLKSGRRINNRRLVVPFEMIRREVKRFVAFISIFILSELLRDARDVIS